MTHLTRTRTVLGLLAATSMLVLSACGGSGDAKSSGKDASSSSSSSSPSADASASVGPDLSGIPDVVAEVNGQEITKDEFVPAYQAAFQQATMQAQSTGQAPDEKALQKQTADDLVSTELLVQEAKARNIKVTTDDVDAELETVAKQNQMASAEELLKAVEKNGMTADQARAQVETQLLVEQLVTDEDGGKKATEKELRALYAQAKKQAAAGQQGQKIPPFAQVRDQIAEQAQSERVNKVAQALVKDLRKGADIKINL